MIKIEKINPIDSSSVLNVSLLKWIYYSRVLNYTNPKKNLEDALKNNKLGGIDLSADNNKREILCFILKRLPLFIMGAPIVLDKIKKHFESSTNNWQRLIYNDAEKSTTDFGKELIKLFGYDEYFRNRKEKGIWLAKQLNIKTCPYCNAQYTLYVEDKNMSIAKFQFDHFFPKNQYPYFSLSLFNLIPSCASCNQTKSSKPVNLKEFYHPYYNSIAFCSEFIVNYPDKVENWNFKAIRDLDSEKIEVKFKSKYPETENFVKKHDEMFHITAVYSRHKDVAQELLVKSILYNKFYKKGTKSIEGLFPDNKTMLRYILGNYMLEEDILKRPLSKFTQDIAKQLKLI